MERTSVEVAHAYPRIEVPPREGARPAAASCPALEVRYQPWLEDGPRMPAPDRIDIFMPGEGGLFHAMYSAPDGHVLRAIVRAPQICVAPPKQSYRLACQGQGDLVSISLDAAYYASRAQEAFGAPREVMERFGASDPFLRGIGNVLRNGFRAGRAPTQAYLESLASVIAIHVAANYDRRESRTPVFSGLAPHKLQRVLDFIEQHLPEAIHVRDLAQVVHMSPYHFARMFKQATGQPPHVYITSQRMDLAKNLLGATDMSLVQVASSVGYQTQAHFTGVFHKQVGLTPRTFRLKCRAERRDVN
jgi:AraC family transcriptional regulator